MGLTFKEKEPISVLKSLKTKIKAKINYSENPNQPDFFRAFELGKYKEIGQIEKLTGFWTGTYDLKNESVFWLNPNLDRLKVLKLVDFKTYNVYLKFFVLNNERVLGLQLNQEDINYRTVNIEIANDKQINYWAEASSSDWLEIVRGKIFRLNDNELFTVFQTTVYEEKNPIYAFRGELVLRKGG
ncbi:MAG: hypothetical protein HY094_01790 [Candidatus Melainabacteria bacterium]|nr:hypothetical protein [Candidatus Melainabacteria bacterium]